MSSGKGDTLSCSKIGVPSALFRDKKKYLYLPLKSQKWKLCQLSCLSMIVWVLVSAFTFHSHPLLICGLPAASPPTTVNWNITSLGVKPPQFTPWRPPSDLTVFSLLWDRGSLTLRGTLWISFLPITRTRKGTVCWVVLTKRHSTTNDLCGGTEDAHRPAFRSASRQGLWFISKSWVKWLL